MKQSLGQLEMEITEACGAAGRSRSEITLVAVSKTFPAEAIREAYALGIRHFGENRVQELTQKAAELQDLSFTWHLVGSLQTNKVRAVLPLLGLLHSLDRIELAEEIARRGSRPIDALLQVNTTSEGSKSGAEPGEVGVILDRVRALPQIRLHGFMTIGPLDGDERAVRAAFALLRGIRDHHQALHPDLNLSALSMGMSSDFAWAIAEGATHLRVGTRLFGHRPRAT